MATSQLLEAVRKCPADHPEFTVKQGVLLYKERVFIPSESALQPLIIFDFHNSPIGGHAEIHRTVACIAGTFYWPDLSSSVHDYISRCATFQSIEPFNNAHKVFYSHFRFWVKFGIPSLWILFLICLIFQGKPPSWWCGSTSKQAHFWPLGSQFTAEQVAEIFVKDVVRHHGVPSNIVSDRDHLFVSSFWREFFKLQGTLLAMSSAYHQQSNS